MKRIFTTIIFLACLTQISFSQCDIPNASFENWTTDILSIEGPAGEVSAEAMLPDSVASVIRFLFMGFGAAFDQSIAQIVEDDPQGFLGISQSTDASDGDLAVQLKGGYDLNFADIYGINDCNEIPDTFYVDVKVQNVNGPDSDTLSVLLMFDQGIAPFPGDVSDVLNSPAGVFTEFVYASDTGYHTLAVPITKNFDAPIDTFYYNLIATTHNDSYFLIDNMRFENGETEMCMFENAEPFSINGTSRDICFCDEFEEDIVVDATLNTSSMYRTHLIALDIDDDIVYISDVETGSFSEDDFCPDDVFSLVEIHFTDVMGLEAGNNINDLTGCFEVSEKLTITGTFVDEFDYQLFNGGELVEDEAFEVCLSDDAIEVFTVEFTSTLNYAILVLDDDNIVVDQINNANTTTFENLTSGTYTFGVIQHTGVLDNFIGQNAFSVFDAGECIYPSGNFNEVTILVNEGSCVSRTQDAELLSSFSILENPVDETLVVVFDGQQNADNVRLNIANLGGQTFVSEMMDNQSATHSYDVASLPSGIYFISIQSTTGQATRKFVKI